MAFSKLSMKGTVSLQIADARHVSEHLQATANEAAQESSACLQQASEAGSSFLRMAGSLMQTAQALPAGTDGLSQFCKESGKPLENAVAVLQEACRIIKARRFPLDMCHCKSS